LACIDGMNCKVSDPEEKQQSSHYGISNSAIIKVFRYGKTL